MTELPPAVRLGGRYELGAVLGAGGTAHVYRGVDLVLGRPVAVKVFRGDVEFHDSARMEAEGRTLAALNHPGLVAVYDAGTAQTPAGVVHYLVMELVEGPSLATAAYDGSLPSADVARIGAELGDALAYVHDHGTIHRDIKPANILIDQDRRAKITDFGIARLVDTARRTATGLTIGTAAYLSPEQLTSASVGPASDVYSLGLVLLECLTGRREYPGTGAESALARLHRSPHIPVSLPTPWTGLLAAMTDTDATCRPSAADVAAALRAAPDNVESGSTSVQDADTRPLASTLERPEPVTALLTSASGHTFPFAAEPPATALLTTPQVTPSARPVPPSRRSRHPARSLIAALAVLVAVAVVVTGIMLTRGSTSTPRPATSPTSDSIFARDLNDLNKAVTP